jgi:hypothetical protein
MKDPKQGIIKRVQETYDYYSRQGQRIAGRILGDRSKPQPPPDYRTYLPKEYRDRHDEGSEDDRGRPRPPDGDRSDTPHEPKAETPTEKANRRKARGGKPSSKPVQLDEVPEWDKPHPPVRGTMAPRGPAIEWPPPVPSFARPGAMAFRPVGAPTPPPALSAAVGGTPGVAGGGAAAAAGAFAGGIAAATLLVAEGAKAFSNVMGATAVGIQFNGNKLMNGVASITENVPVLGQAVGGVIRSLTDLHQSVEATLARFAKYNGGLAVQQAQEQVRQIQRDMDRAQRFGPELSNLATARTSTNTKLDDLMDRVAPLFLKLAEFGVDRLGDLADLVSAIVESLAEIGISIVEILRTLPLVGADSLKGIDDTLKRMARPVPTTGAGGLDVLRQLLSARAAPGAAPALPPVAGPGVMMPGFGMGG